ncbi:hypothetical protein Barb7_00729 [Bacteroidales bacterium Barb7]|nr:hypothetical protein Barb7_00729 [Bacteroidales bacterium Barb7]
MLLAGGFGGGYFFGNQFLYLLVESLGLLLFLFQIGLQSGFLAVDLLHFLLLVGFFAEQFFVFFFPLG